jgi:hypothetical protein
MPSSTMVSVVQLPGAQRRDADRIELDGNADVAVGSRARPISNSKSDRPQNRLALPLNQGSL